MLAFHFAILPQPIDLGGITLERSRVISGLLVVASFLNVAAESCSWCGRTTRAPRRQIFRIPRMCFSPSRLYAAAGDN